MYPTGPTVVMYGVFSYSARRNGQNEAKRGLETANETLEARVDERTEELRAANEALKQKMFGAKLKR